LATLKAMFKLFDGYSSTIDRIYKKTDQATNKILKASGATDKLNKQLEATGASANTASSGLTKLIGRIVTIAGIIKGMNLVDEYTYTAARLDLINDGLQTQAELQDKIFAAADRSRGAYSDMAEAVSKMGLLAGEAFTTNDELIAFTELVQKAFKVSGATISEQQGAMRQLTQAMASGRLQGDELVSIMENAPMIFDAIAKYMGMTKGELREIARTGAITSDIIKNAMFMAADDINEKFADMPMTFGDIWNKIKNRATRAFSSVMEDVNIAINTEKLDKALDVITGGFVLAAKAAGAFIDTVVNGWDTIGPILAMLGGVYLTTIIKKLWAMIPPLYAQAAAWLAAHWPILLVIAAIAGAISAARQLGYTWDEILGFIGGALGVFAAFFYNVFVSIWNVVASFVNFFGNVFRDPVAAVKALFFDLASTVLGYISTMARAIEDIINKIPGVTVDMTSGLDKWRKNFEDLAVEARSEGELIEYVKRMDYIDLSEGYARGSKIGRDIYTGFNDALGNFTDQLTNAFDLSQFGTSMNPIHVTSDEKLKVDMADEDLKYLRDIAQREYINKFTTATLAPNISIKFGDVKETADVNKIHGRIRRILQEEIAMAAEGSYA